MAFNLEEQMSYSLTFQTIQPGLNLVYLIVGFTRIDKYYIIFCFLKAIN